MRVARLVVTELYPVAVAHRAPVARGASLLGTYPGRVGAPMDEESTLAALFAEGGAAGATADKICAAA